MSRELKTIDPSQAKILIADDEASVRQVLKTRLSISGYNVMTAADGKEVLDCFHKQTPDLIVLDVMLPKLDGYGVCQALRQESTVPIIMLTALADVSDRITGLQAGADDYMVKPFSLRELESRIRCILRRVKQATASEATPSRVIQAGSLQLDTNKRQVYRNHQLVRLTYLEFSLLELLISRAGECISRTEFLETIWGYVPQHFVEQRIVDVYMSRLREKLQESPSQPEYILTVRGRGYTFQRFPD